MCHGGAWAASMGYAGTNCGIRCARRTGWTLVSRGRHHIRAGVSILRIILETQPRETPTAPDLIGTPFVKHEELEIRYANHFLHPQCGRDLNGVAERHRSRYFIRLTDA